MTMLDAEMADIGAIFQSQLGEYASWKTHDRTIKTPMNFTLDLAEKQLNSKFEVFWVDNAVPEMFCLEGFSKPVVVFNPRFIELWGNIRSVITASFYSTPVKSDLVEQLCLELMAERSLWKHNDPDFAASAILKGSSIHPGIVHVRNTMQSMEYEPITPI